MTAANTTRGTKLVLKVEWIPLSGTYETACTLNADRAFEQSASVVTDFEPDCDNLEGLANQTTDKDILSFAFNATGKVHKQDVKKFNDWLRSEDTLSCKVILDDDDAANIITHTGDFHLTTFNMSGTRGQRVTANLALVADGAVTPTYGANVD